ncbi:MAG: flagellar basal body P-ring formation chaperone FlgA [Gemmatimonadaceae bacterium]
MSASRPVLVRLLAAVVLMTAVALLSARPLFPQSVPAGMDASWIDRVRRTAAAVLHVGPAAVVLEWRTMSPGTPMPNALLHLDRPTNAVHWTLTTTASATPPARWMAELRIGVEELAAVATRRIARGTVLTASDISVARVVTWGPPSSDRTRVGPGWITRRVILENELLREPAVSPAPLVAPGQPVLFVFEQQGIRLTIDGRATGAGSLGDRVAVRLGARRRVEGIVTGAGQVTASDSPRTS